MRFQQLFPLFSLVVLTLGLTSLVNQASATPDLICYQVLDREQIDLDEYVNITLTIRNTILLVPIKNVTVEQTFPTKLEIVNSTASLAAFSDNELNYTFPFIEIDETVIFYTLCRPNRTQLIGSNKTEEPIDQTIPISAAKITFLYLDNSQGGGNGIETNNLDVTIFHSNVSTEEITYTKPPPGTIDIGLPSSYLIGYGLIVVFIAIAVFITVKRK
ncbi:MAG: hypothetical protein ACFFBD_26945 [Candidatus Hodarchaeota archaeon]